MRFGATLWLACILAPTAAVSTQPADTARPNPRFSLLLAGDGFKSSIAYSWTFDVGYRAVEQPVSVPNLFATILHQLSADHRRLTNFHHGRKESLTDPAVPKARVVTDDAATR